VRVCLTKAKNSDDQEMLVPGIVKVTKETLGRALGQVGRWQRFDKMGLPIRIDPPKEVIEQILDMAGESPFPPLIGVIACPTMRRDGSLLTADGYDPVTGYVLYSSVKMPALSARPTKAEAKAAATELEYLLEEFPFADDASKSVALSMLLCATLRPSMDVVPLHHTDAPDAGAGKTHLDNTVSMVATGERCAVIALSPDPEETEKRLVGAVIAGRSIICLDNLTQDLEGSFLCQMVEQTMLEVKPLGRSDKLLVRNAFLVVSNGNNVSAVGDLVRRTLNAKLDPNVESPELRTFKRNPIREIRRDRGKYIAACLIIGRAYIVAGRPEKLRQPLESYEEWSDLVRSALVWLGYVDPVTTIGEAKAADPRRQEAATVFGAWIEAIGPDMPLTAPDIIRRATGGGLTSGEPANPGLEQALLTVAQKYQSSPPVIEPRRLGKWLKHHENRVVSGWKLVIDRRDLRRICYSLKQP
jgi:putative DNA primase/helicase